MATATPADPPHVQIVDNPEASRYELRHDGHVVGVVEYQIDDRVFVIRHVEVVPRLRGHGHSAPFLDEVVDRVVGQDMLVRPVCSYAATHLRAQPERADLLS